MAKLWLLLDIVAPDVSRVQAYKSKRYRDLRGLAQRHGGLLHGMQTKALRDRESDPTELERGIASTSCKLVFASF
jgi:hypothetical protein